MTDLEKMIYECAIQVAPGLYEKCVTYETKARFISVPFFCDGVYDSIIFDRELMRFTHIEYFYQLSKKKVEKRTIPIAEYDINFNIHSN